MYDFAVTESHQDVSPNSKAIFADIDFEPQPIYDWEKEIREDTFCAQERNPFVPQHFEEGAGLDKISSSTLRSKNPEDQIQQGSVMDSQPQMT